MANVKGINIQKQSGNLTAKNRGADMISALIAPVTTKPPGFGSFGDVEPVFSVKDAEALGIDDTYDDTNDELLYWNIREFYRMNTDKPKLYIMPIDKSTLGTNLSNLSDLFDDPDLEYARKLVNRTDGEVRQLGVMINHNFLSGNYTNNIPQEVEANISTAQNYAEWAYGQFRPLQVLMECPDVQDNNGLFAGLPNLRTSGAEATKVSLTIASDMQIVNDRTAYEKRAAIGTLLGSVSARAVNENIGWIQVGNIQELGTNDYVTAGLSNGNYVGNFSSQYQTLEDKGFIFAKPYEGIDGYYWNNDHVCAPLAKDENSISNGRVKDKAACLLRAAYLPEVKSPKQVDPNTGKLPQSVINYFDTIGEKTLDFNMTNEDEISGRSVRTDPDSELINSPKVLHIAFGIVPYGEVAEIKGTLEFVQTV